MFSLFQFLGDEDLRLTILDIGAASHAGSSLLEVPSYKPLIDSGRARILGFEPDDEACRKLNETYGEPHCFFPYFVGNGQPGTFHQTNWSPTGSLLRPNTPLLAKFQLLAEVTTPVGEHSVQTRRLDDIPEIDDADFVKIDVQGAELQVFENAARVLESALLVQTEVAFVEYYAGQPMFADVDTFLRSIGFQFHDFEGVGARAFKPLTNSFDKCPNPLLRPFRQRIWADAYYVKDWMQLERLSIPKLKKYAVLMHDVAGSYDLVYTLLRELDRRTRGALAERYLHLMQDRGVCAAIEPQALDPDWMPVSSQTREDCGDDREDPSVDSILLETDDGTLVLVPASLSCITTYVLLEQERWFEKEQAFLERWLKPGMNAVDIGANVGVYSLSMARRVAPDGSVFAFEPGATNRRHLEIGRSANELRNLSISTCALADAERMGWLELSDYGELNALAEGQTDPGGAERVRVTTLDILEGEQCWPAIDFVKIDAEGQEARILEGGRRFLADQSPLLMIEIKHGRSGGPNLRPTLESLGYASYRLLGDSTLLVPFLDGEPLDTYELNLFWAKPDRAAKLAATGYLVRGTAPYDLTAAEQDAAIGELLDLPYARHFEFSTEDVLGCTLGPALVAYAAYRFLPLSAERRFAALRAALDLASVACQDRQVPTYLVTLSRIAFAFGRRIHGVEVLGQLLGAPPGDIDTPFIPPCPRFEDISPDGRELAWFMASVLEQVERSRAFSSLYVCDDDLLNLRPLCDGHFASAETARRMILVGIMAGMRPSELDAYVRSASRYSHRNADFWARDALSATVVQACAALQRAPDQGAAWTN